MPPDDVTKLRSFSSSDRFVAEIKSAASSSASLRPGYVLAGDEIFLYERTGMDSQGQVLGRFRSTGIRPRFAEKLKANGFQLPRVIFEDI